MLRVEGRDIPNRLVMAVDKFRQLLTRHMLPLAFSVLMTFSCWASRRHEGVLGSDAEVPIGGLPESEVLAIIDGMGVTVADLESVIPSSWPGSRLEWLGDRVLAPTIPHQRRLAMPDVYLLGHPGYQVNTMPKQGWTQHRRRTLMTQRLALAKRTDVRVANIMVGRDAMLSWDGIPDAKNSHRRPCNPMNDVLVGCGKGGGVAIDARRLQAGRREAELPVNIVRGHPRQVANGAGVDAIRRDDSSALL
ncbi:hypothetical protein LY76DRAFT_606509 [Colletotrichum caudatum]|nr:hypothetical protein LY76DRAFT_606509 [Colletotrichum caudatum]